METVQGAATLGRFQYDFQGRRTKKIGEDGIRQYVYDQTSLLTEIDSAGLQVAKYDYGSDRLISLTRSQGRRFFSPDGLRSVTNLTDDTGTVSASYHLDTWGNYRFPQELDAGGDTVAGKNRFGFTGYLFDKETGLYNAKARYFDPQLGRFLTQDSYLGEISSPPSLHRYFYANANPTRYVDPSGHENEPATPAVSQETIRKWERYQKVHPVTKESSSETTERSATTPAVVTEEDNGPVGNLIMRPLRALGRTTVVRKVGEGLAWANDQLEALATKMGIVARVVTSDQAGKQDEGALREKREHYRAFEGQTGDTPGDQIARKHIAVNTGQEFVDTSAEISQELAEQGTRQGAPLGAAAAVGIAGKALRGALARTEPVLVAGRRAIDLGKSYEEGIRNLYGGGASFGSRAYTAVVDGKTVSGVADNVLTVGGRSVAVEAKYVDEWSASLRNPANQQPWSLAEQKTMMTQAQKYSAAFDEVVYHTNSPELARFYGKAFEDRGITNVRFLITPAQK